MLQKVFISLLFLNVVHGCCGPTGNLTCRSEDMAPLVCDTLNTTLSALSVVKTGVDLVGQYLGPIGNATKYIGSTIQPFPYDFENYNTTKTYYNVIIITATTYENISLTAYMEKCKDALLAGKKVVAVHSGYYENCYGRKPFGTLIYITVEEWQEFARLNDLYIIIFEWGIKGLSCASYLTLCECKLSQMAKFLTYVLIQCDVKGANLTVIGYSMGAQILGYVVYDMKQAGQPVAIFIGADPAGPLFNWQYTILQRCALYGYALYSLLLHCNPFELGTNDFLTGTTHVLSRPWYAYVQKNCTFYNPVCNHLYCAALLRLLILGTNISGLFYPTCELAYADKFNITKTGTPITVNYSMLPWKEGYITLN